MKRRKERKWRFYWKNIGGLGRLNRLVAGVASLAAAARLQDENKGAALGLAVMGADLLFAALLGWCPARALLRRPTRRAYRRHYPPAESD